MDEIRAKIEADVVAAVTTVVKIMSNRGFTLNESEHPAAIDFVVKAFEPLVGDLASKAVQLEVFRDELFAVAAALGVTQPRLVRGELAPVAETLKSRHDEWKTIATEAGAELGSLRVEVERAKEDRNRSGVEERRKYLPHLQELHEARKELEAELTACLHVVGVGVVKDGAKFTHGEVASKVGERFQGAVERAAKAEDAFRTLATVCDGTSKYQNAEPFDLLVNRITERMAELNDFSAMMRQPNAGPLPPDVARFFDAVARSEALFKRLETVWAEKPPATYQPVTKTPHLCPKCKGQKIVSMPPHVAGDVEFFTSDATGYPCQICNGEGVLWQ